MSDERVISQADLSSINSHLRLIHGELETLDSRVNTVNSNMKVVYDEIGSLAKEFYDFVCAQKRANRLVQAETRLVRIRQELEKKYGHYDIVRRTTTGILQADDLGIVKKDTISNVTEELMILTPGYWLAPCLVALAAWINDQPELADKALREGIRRNDEKTSLFFALICRRADRKDACLKWTQRYLANQDERDLDRKTIILLDAFASGLLGVDTEGVISRQMDEWLARLEEKPGFKEQQIKQWSDAINLKRRSINTSSYTYLRQYSKTWFRLQDILEGAYLHAEILDYLTAIFDQEASVEGVKEQLDEILNSLVTDYDDEELPLRKEEKYEQFVVDFKGDENRANQNMAVEQSAFDVHKDFTQLLTDAAMKPESSHASVSIQKFAFALSSGWVTSAYTDVINQNRMKIPNEIEINFDTFNGRTTNGQNENELIGRFNNLVNSEKMNALAQCSLSSFEQFCLYGGGVIAAIGVGMTIAGMILSSLADSSSTAGGIGMIVVLGLIAIIAGVGMMINYFSKKKQCEQNWQNAEKYFEEKRHRGEEIIRATLAEVVDFREEFIEKDAESQQVLDFLGQLTPEQYVRKLRESSRRIKI